MSGERVAPTRANLLRARHRLERVERGRDLLQRKREALMEELFRVAGEAMDARRGIDDAARAAYAALVDAAGVEGREGLRARAWPPRSVLLEVRARRVWGVDVADVVDAPPVKRSPEARGWAPGAPGPAPREAAEGFEELVDLLVGAAPREMLVRRLADALARASRQVHALEHRVGPALEAQVAGIRRTLAQREREDQVRLKRLRARLQGQGKGP